VARDRFSADSVLISGEGKVHLHLSALGCRLNEAEIESLTRAALAAGHIVVVEPAEADWAIINTCAVTHVAAHKSRQAIRRLHAQAPNARVAVLGCYGTLSSGECLALPGVALVISNADKDRALELIAAASPLEFAVERALSHGSPATRRTRAFIKVQDGCGNHCTYCIVRTARGRSASRLECEVLAEARARLDEGAQEIVLSGVNIGAFGRDLAPEGGERWSLARLVRHLLAETQVPRLRLSSLEPWDVDEALLDLWRDPRLCRQLHLPLQSGSDSVLQRMGRPMDSGVYRRLVLDVRQRVPEMSLSTDLMVGFPGETEDDMSATCSLAEAVGFSRLHIFRFSPRPGTPAAEMQDRVPAQVSQARARRLATLGTALAEAYHRRYVGRTASVLFETRTTHAGVTGWTGLTDNYLRVWVPCAGNLHNQIRDVICTGSDATGLWGTLTSSA
jgi:threonylcarbamoyladenosine tRNA methylthiotransferase MtaB